MESPKINVKYEEEFIMNSRGMKLFTCKWVPAHSEPKGLVFWCHGYGMECSISFQGFAHRLARAGYAVYGIDYEGHGKSSGIRGYIPNFDNLVNDCSDYFTTVSERLENKKKKRILMGESMGGAVVLLIHRKKPDYWDMAVLLAPMCKIGDDIKPHPLVIYLAKMLGRIVPTWKILPAPDMINATMRLPKRRDEMRSNPLFYSGCPRLATGNESMRVSMDLEARLNEVSLPFLVIHGGQDRAIYPSVSKLLYTSARSSDKTFQLYPDMWHCMTYGELPENTDTVCAFIITWLDARVA